MKALISMNKGILSFLPQQRDKKAVISPLGPPSLLDRILS